MPAAPSHGNATATGSGADHAPDMLGKHCVLTGASTGIGRATALGLARRGASLLLVSRHAGRGHQALDELKTKSGNPHIELLLCDLSSQHAVRGLAAEILSKLEHIDVLINNAGLITRRRRLSEDGIELQLAVNHLAPFLLTNLLLDRLKASAPSRIVTVASAAHTRGRLDFDDLQYERDYHGPRAYARTKLANIVFSYELARRLEGSGVTANCLHPGVVHTKLLRNFSRPLDLLFQLASPFFKGPERGAQTPLHLACAPELSELSGRYFIKCSPAHSSSLSRDPELGARLWEASEILTGMKNERSARDSSAEAPPMVE